MPAGRPVIPDSLDYFIDEPFYENNNAREEAWYPRHGKIDSMPERRPGILDTSLVCAECTDDAFYESEASEMKRCHICGAPCDSQGYCSQPKNHQRMNSAGEPIRVLYRVAAWMSDGPDEPCAWEYVKLRGHSDYFFDLQPALIFAKRVSRRKNVARVEVRLELSVQSFIGSIGRWSRK